MIIESLEPPKGKRQQPPQSWSSESRFSIGSALLTSITKNDAQVRRGETRQDLKIPTVSDGSLPRALSCSHLTVSPHHSAVMAAFSHSTPDAEVWLGGSLQAGLYARTPRSARLPRLVQVTILLIPTLTDTTNRHWR